jgi:Chitobiase/beta-hexosaminidase C-terminal domain
MRAASLRAASLLAALCAAGCNIVFGFDDIHPVDASVPPPTVYSSPGPRLHAMGYDFAEAVSVTLAADDPTTVIYYTTDGTPPSLASKHGTTPVTGIAMSSSSTTLTYFGSAAGGDSAFGSDAYDIATAAQSVAGYYVSSVLLDGKSPVVVVNAGQVLSAATAKVQAWVQSSCPDCAAQIVYGVDTTDQGCLFDSVRDAPSGPGVYPGFTRNATFKVTAPMTPGVHQVRITHSEQTTCAAAMAMDSLVTRPDQSRIGVLIVQ